MKRKLALALAGVMTVTAALTAPMNLFAAVVYDLVESGQNDGKYLPGRGLVTTPDAYWISSGKGSDLVVPLISTNSGAKADHYFDVQLTGANWYYSTTVAKNDASTPAATDTSGRPAWEPPSGKAVGAVNSMGNMFNYNVTSVGSGTKIDAANLALRASNPETRVTETDANGNIVTSVPSTTVTPPNGDDYEPSSNYLQTDNFLSNKTAWYKNINLGPSGDNVVTETTPFASFLTTGFAEEIVPLINRVFWVEELFDELGTYLTTSTTPIAGYAFASQASVQIAHRLAAKYTGSPAGSDTIQDVLNSILGTTNQDVELLKILAPGFATRIASNNANPTSAARTAKDVFISVMTESASGHLTTMVSATEWIAILGGIWDELARTYAERNGATGLPTLGTVGTAYGFDQIAGNLLTGLESELGTRLTSLTGSLDALTYVAPSPPPTGAGWDGTLSVTGTGVPASPVFGPTSIVELALNPTPTLANSAASSQIGRTIPTTAFSSLNGIYFNGIDYITNNQSGVAALFAENSVAAVNAWTAAVSTSRTTNRTTKMLTSNHGYNLVGPIGILGAVDVAPYANTTYTYGQYDVGSFIGNLSALATHRDQFGSPGRYDTYARQVLTGPTYANAVPMEYEIVYIKDNTMRIHWVGNSTTDHVVVIPLAIKATTNGAITATIVSSGSQSGVNGYGVYPVTEPGTGTLKVSVDGTRTDNYQIALDNLRITEPRTGTLFSNGLGAVRVAAPFGYYFTNSDANLISADVLKRAPGVTVSTPGEVYRWIEVNASGQPREVLYFNGFSVGKSQYTSSIYFAGLTLAPYRNDEAPYGVDLVVEVNLYTATSGLGWNSTPSSSTYSGDYFAASSGFKRITGAGSSNEVFSVADAMRIFHGASVGQDVTTVTVGQRTSWTIGAAVVEKKDFAAGLVKQKAAQLRLTTDNLGFDIFAGRDIEINLTDKDGKLLDGVKFSRVGIWTTTNALAGSMPKGSETDAKWYDFNFARAGISLSSIQDRPVHFNGYNSLKLWGFACVDDGKPVVEMRLELSADANFSGPVYVTISHGGATLTTTEEIGVVAPNVTVKTTGISTSVGNETIKIGSIVVSERVVGLWALNSKVQLAVAEYGNAYPSNRAYFSAIDGRLEESIILSNESKTSLQIANKRVANDASIANSGTGRGVIEFSIARKSDYRLTDTAKTEPGVVEVKNAIISTLAGTQHDKLSLIVGGTAVVDNFATGATLKTLDNAQVAVENLRYDFFDSWGYVAPETESFLGGGAQLNKVAISFDKGDDETDYFAINGEEPTNLVDVDNGTNFRSYIEPSTNRTMVPLKAVSLLFGLDKPVWNPVDKTAEVYVGGKTITFTQNSAVVKVQESGTNRTIVLVGENGELFYPEIPEGESRMYLPIKALAMAFDVQLTYDPSGSQNVVTFDPSKNYEGQAVK